MTKLTAEQREEINDIIAERTEGLTLLTKDQRDEIEKLIESKIKAASLSPGQKWEAGVIVATLLGGSLAIFGAAGIFFIKVTTETIAKNTVVETKQDQVAGLLRDDINFVKTVAGSLTTLPVGSVVAFDLPTGCPTGWAEYANARGRVIVGTGQGTGLSGRAYQQIGGAEQYQLSVDQLPPHKFQTTARAAQPSNVDRYDAGGRNYPVITASTGLIESDTIGKGEPISLMQPYVALYYCRKSS
ncbi:hypothetical protein NKI71_13700 [Mesorhizobium sp. M0510]|uniref:hypothetical protein n=1 Tax=Mesorhizobium sp. M0510 TaxID=2956954 RepID=UPI00333C234F